MGLVDTTRFAYTSTYRSGFENDLYPAIFLYDYLWTYLQHAVVLIFYEGGLSEKQQVCIIHQRIMREMLKSFLLKTLYDFGN